MNYEYGLWMSRMELRARWACRSAYNYKLQSEGEGVSETQSVPVEILYSIVICELWLVLYHFSGFLMTTHSYTCHLLEELTPKPLTFSQATFPHAHTPPSLPLINKQMDLESFIAHTTPHQFWIENSIAMIT